MLVSVLFKIDFMTQISSFSWGNFAASQPIYGRTDTGTVPILIPKQVPFSSSSPELFIVLTYFGRLTASSCSTSSTTCRVQVSMRTRTLSSRRALSFPQT